jgi:hypothetical protein
MPNIGNLAVQLSLDAALFASGLDRSTKDGQAFAGHITKIFSGIGAGIAGAEAIGGGAAGLYGGLKSGLHEMAAAGQEAHKLGISLESLASLQLLAGDNAEGLGHAMVRLGANMSKAAQGGKEAAKPFEQLGLSVQQLEAMAPDQAFGAVLDKINLLAKAGDKGNVAKELFGREGLSIIEKFERGTISINETMAQIKAHGGVGFDMKDAKGALEAEKSIHEMESSFNRIKLSLISEFSPLVKQVADGIAGMVSKAGGKGAFQGLADSARQFLKGLTAGMITVAGAVGKIVANLQITTDMLRGSKDGKGGWFDPKGRGDADWLGGLFDPKSNSVWRDSKGNKLKDAGSDNPIVDMLKQFNAALDKPFDLPHDQVGGNQLAPDQEEARKLAGEIGDFNVKIAGMIETFGMGGEALERFKLAQKGATAAMLAIADANLKTLDGLNKQKKLHEDAQHVIEETQPPFEKFNEQFSKLREYLAAGEISQGQYAAALAKDFKELTGKEDLKDHAPGALLAGSDAAHSADVAFERQGAGGSIQEQIKSGIDRLIETQKQTELLNKKIADILDDRLSGRNAF